MYGLLIKHGSTGTSQVHAPFRVVLKMAKNLRLIRRDSWIHASSVDGMPNDWRQGAGGGEKRFSGGFEIFAFNFGHR